jgi:drug/metabolite transporter (DMT)-like permease
MIAGGIPVLLTYGITPLLNKHILEHISVEGYILFSTIVYFFAAVVAYFIFFRNTFNGDYSVLKSKPYLGALIAVYALSLLFVTEYLYFKVLRNNKAYLLTALLASYPLVTIGLSYLFFKESIEFVHIIGAVLIVMGVILISQ